MWFNNRGKQGNGKSGNLSFGPWTFWLQDTWKSQNEILLFGPKWHTNRGNHKIRNAHWKDTSLPLHYFCPWLTSQSHIHICYWFIWEMMLLKPYVIFSSDMFPGFFQAIAKLQCPFKNNIVFINLEILWAFVADINWLYVTANLLMNVHTCFYWNQMTVASVMCLPVLEDLFRQGDKIFHIHVA